MFSPLSDLGVRCCVVGAILSDIVTPDANVVVPDIHLCSLCDDVGGKSKLLLLFGPSLVGKRTFSDSCTVPPSHLRN